MTVSPMARCAISLTNDRVLFAGGHNNTGVRPRAGWSHCFRSDSNSNMLTHPARGVQAYVGTVDIFARDPKVGVQQLVLSLPFAIISLPFAAFPQ